MPWLLILTLNFTPLAPAPTIQGFVSSGVLRSLCSAPIGDSDHGASLCLGYLAGVTDQLLARESKRWGSRRKFCLPAGVTMEDLRDVVLSFQSETVAADDVAAAPVIRLAFEAAFPCGMPGARP
jgi:hypothetical protein